jgi:hypothetical protein
VKHPFKRPLSIVGLACATLASTPSRAEPLIYDANGAVVASPSGLSVEGYLRAYLTIDGVMTVVHFTQKSTSSTLLEWSGGGVPVLFYRSTDCSGPALIAFQEAYGVVPSVVLAEGHHAWLHLAEGTEGIGAVSMHSQRTAGKACSETNTNQYAWRARPGIDLNAMFTPPFSIH